MISLKSRRESLSLIRNLYRALRTGSSELEVKNSPIWKDVVTKYGRMEVKSEADAITIQELGRTYLNYLVSTQNHVAIISSFKGAGERSTRETAKLMGFKLPDEKKCS